MKLRHPPRSLDERLDDLQDSVIEQLCILKALATSQALAVEQQGQTFLAQIQADTLLKKVNANVCTVVKTTDSILGISKRTETLIRAVRHREARTLLTLCMDPWFCLYAYMLLHPIAPSFLEQMTSVWQFVLLLYRCTSVIDDGKQSVLYGTSLGGILFLYATSPYKALYYLYWLNKAFVYGELTAAPALALTLPITFPDCAPAMHPTSLVCLADYTVEALSLGLASFYSAIQNSEIAVQISALVALEQAIWYGFLYSIYSSILQGLYARLPTRLKYFF